MNFPVWAITGFTLETFVSSSSVEKRAPDETIGRPQEITETIMHGTSYSRVGKRRGYAYLKASLQSMKDYENTPLRERGLGAVTGGVSFYPANDGSPDDPFIISQRWGTVTPSKAEFLGGFLSFDESKLYHVMACFDLIDVAHVSGFWRNGRVTFGPDIRRDREIWGKHFNAHAGTGNYCIALEKVKSTIVVDSEFVEPDDSKGTVQPELVSSSQTFINHSSVALADKFDVEVSMVNTHTFEFEEGQEADWSAGWKDKMPLMSETNTGEAIKVDVSFGAYQSSATSKTRTIELSAGISIPPMSRCLATARYSKRILTLSAVLTLQKTYTNGSVMSRRVPAKYIGVSCSKFEIDLQDVRVESLQ